VSLKFAETKGKGTAIQIYSSKVATLNFCVQNFKNRFNG
jgi:hypothetical protein